MVADPTFRRSTIKVALDELVANGRSADFQRMAVQLAKGRCPELIASELSHDGGEDAFPTYTALSGRNLAVACSFTANLIKIESDLRQIRHRKPGTNELWFFTPKAVRSRTSDPWRKVLNEEHRVALTVFSQEEIVSSLMEPQFQDLLPQYLGIPSFVELPRRIPCQLPDRPLAGELFGRAQEYRELSALIGRGESTFVYGPPGFGKSAIAGEVVRAIIGDNEASLRASPFSDGVVLLDLYHLKGRSIDAWTVLADALIGDDDSLSPADQRAKRACRNRRVLIIVEGAEEATGRDGRCRLHELLSVCDPVNRRLILTRDLAQTVAGRTVEVKEALSQQAASDLFEKITHGAIDKQIRHEVLAKLQGHPLALTWAANHLVVSGENPRQWLADWEASGLTNLSDHTLAQHTLRWLFGRSVRGLNSDEQTVLSAAGLLAEMEFPLTAAVAALKESAEPRLALRRLVQLGLLHISPHHQNPDLDCWHFTHVLGYQFCREASRGSSELRDRLARWAHAELTDCLSRGDTVHLHRALFQIRALLGTDNDESLSYLATFCLYDVVDRTNDLGQLGLVDLTLRSVAEWMETLPPHRSQDDFWQRARGVLLDMLGDLQLVQGDLPAALRSYTDGMNIAEKLVRSDPANALWQRDLSVSHNKLGNLQLLQGNLAAALRSYTDGKNIAEKLARSDPTNALWQRDLGISHNKLGNLQQAQGNLTAALRSYTDGKNIAEKLAWSDPTGALWQRDLSLSHNKLGNLQRFQGDLAAALRSYTDGKNIAEKLARSDPTNALWQRDLNVSYENLGELQQLQGDLAAALRSYTDGKNIAEKLTRSDPTNALWQRDLNVSYENLGELRQLQGDLEAALCSYTDGKEIAEKLARSDLTNTLWQWDLTASYINLGDLQQAQGDLTATLRSYTDGKEIAEKLARLDPTNAEWQRNLSVCHNKLGNLQQAQGNLTAALRSYTECWEIRDKLARSDHTNVVWQWDLTASYIKLGDLQLARGDLTAALSSYTHGKEIAEKLAHSDSDNAAWQRDLTVTYTKLGDLQQAQGDLTGALHSYTESRVIREKLVRSDPTNAVWQRDLNVCYIRLGDLQQAQGNLAAARRSYTNGMNIAKKLARSDLTNAAWQQDLSLNYIKLGTLQQAQGDLTAARRSYINGKDITERLVYSDPTNTEWQRDLSYLLNELTKLEGRRGFLAEALKCAEASLVIDERLARLDPTNVIWRNDLKVSRSLTTFLRAFINDLTEEGWSS